MEINNSNNYVAIMAGGVGTRFWPESRQRLPKQFLDILGTGMTLLQSTFERVKDLCPLENIYLVTSHQYVDIIKEQLPEFLHQNIIAEPFKKNTLPAAAYVSYKIQHSNPKANIILAPADHLILDTIKFHKAAAAAYQFLDTHQDAIISFAVKPTRPDTTFGYVQYTPTELNGMTVYKAKTFTEKPDLELARIFLKSGDFAWNTGILAWSVAAFETELNQTCPELAEVFHHGKDYYNTPKEYSSMERLYMQCTNVSIDFGLLEKTKNVYVLPTTFGWTDLATWQTAYEQQEKDFLGNCITGKNVMMMESEGNLVRVSDSKLAIIQGLQNYIIIDTEDALLICERSKEQLLREYVGEIKRNFGEQFL